MFPDEAERLRQLEVSYPTDSRIPLMPVPGDLPDRKGPLTESEFRGWLGQMTGLTDLTEGLETGNLGQAAFGAGMTLLTFTPGAVLRPLGKGFHWLGGKFAGEAEQGLATELGALSNAGVDGARPGVTGSAPMWSHPIDPRPGSSLYVPEPASPHPPGARVGGEVPVEAVPAILDYPRGELPWASREAVPPAGGVGGPPVVVPHPSARSGGPQPWGGGGHGFHDFGDSFPGSMRRGAV